MTLVERGNRLEITSVTKMATTIVGGDDWPDDTAQNIRLLTVDAHTAMRAGFQKLFEDQRGVQVTAEASNGKEAISACNQRKPDVVLTGLNLPDMHTEELITELCDRFPGISIITVSAFKGAQAIKRSLRAGAKGYLLKNCSCEELVMAVRRVHNGHKYVSTCVSETLADAFVQSELTDRELDVLEVLKLGRSNKRIAAELGVSQSTIKIHVSNILEKLGATDRTEAVILALQQGIVRLEL